MADGPYGARTIQIDINDVVTARSIRPAPQAVFIQRIVLNGKAPLAGEEGNIILREKVASTGNPVLEIRPLDSAVYDHQEFEVNRWCRGLYMDALTTGWTQATGSKALLQIHTR